MEPWRGNRRRLLGVLEEAGAGSLILAGKSNVTYATGLREPSGVLVLSEKCGSFMLVPLLDYYRVGARLPGDFELYAFHRGGEAGLESDVPPKRVIEGSIAEGLAKLLDQCKGGVLADLASMDYGLAKSIVEKLNAADATGKISRARMVKSDEEVELVKQAAALADKAYSQAVRLLEEGVSEADIASEVYSAILRGGGWDVAFPTIVAFYSNTAYPHHSPGTDRLSVEGPVLVDWGAVYSGYRSDATRTTWWGYQAPSGFRRHLEDVVEAVNAALEVLAPGVSAGDVDNAARRVLKNKGLSKYFIHGLGHGVGVDVHEEPYLRPASDTVLEPNTIVTIEPGIYLPGLYGIRVEDLVLVTRTGFKPLTSLPHIIP